MVTSQSLYLILLGCVALERIVELLLSRRNAARAFARGGIEVGRGDFRIMASVHSLFLVACAAEVFGLDRRFPGWIGWVALCLAFLSQALRYWAISTLGDRWNVRIVLVPGDAPITSGPYRYLRHPNYLAVGIEFLAIPLVHGAFFTAALFSLANVALLRTRIRTEEEALGEPYQAHFADRPRFFPIASPRGPRPG